MTYAPVSTSQLLSVTSPSLFLPVYPVGSPGPLPQQPTHSPPLVNFCIPQEASRTNWVPSCQHRAEAGLQVGGVAPPHRQGVPWFHAPLERSSGDAPPPRSGRAMMDLETGQCPSVFHIPSQCVRVWPFPVCPHRRGRPGRTKISYCSTSTAVLWPPMPT